MENASKALIMAAEVLIGIMIISIGVYLFNTLGAYSAETTASIEDAQITQFNEQFLRFSGNSGNTTEPIKCTIHDIVGVANLANKINSDNGFTEEEDASDSSYYIQIDLQIGARTYKNIEAYEQSELLNLIKENSIIYLQDGNEQRAETKYFKCSGEPGFGEYTKLVNYMKFVEI